jgi:hypothetical protein
VFPKDWEVKSAASNGFFMNDESTGRITHGMTFKFMNTKVTTIGDPFHRSLEESHCDKTHWRFGTLA